MLNLALEGEEEASLHALAQCVQDCVVNWTGSKQ